MSTNVNWHRRNKHKHGYDFNELCRSTPALTDYIVIKQNQEKTIDFSSPNAVKTLNKALLRSHYKINEWDIPEQYLCPGVPGRVDYLHYLADLLKISMKGEIDNNHVKLLDIGTGASLIYPLLGVSEYNWQFVASDIDPISINNAKQLLLANPVFEKHISCRLQSDENLAFQGIIKKNEFFTFTLCNPPFHLSQNEASKGSHRKLQNLQQGKNKAHSAVNNSHYKLAAPALNFGGQKAELWCDGGEVKFIRNMIRDSKAFRTNVLWFTSLVSKKDNLSAIKLSLKKAKVSQVKIIKMTQGQKITRVICWSFMDKVEQVDWIKCHLN